MKETLKKKSALCLALAGCLGIGLAERHESEPWAVSLREFVGSHAESLKDASDRQKKCSTSTGRTVNQIQTTAHELLEELDSSRQSVDPERIRAFLDDARKLTADRQVWNKLLSDFQKKSEKEIFAEWRGVLDSISDPELKRSLEADFAHARSISDQEIERLEATIAGLNSALAQAEDVGRALRSLDFGAQAKDVNDELSTKADEAQGRVRDFIAETGSILKLLGG